jgi:hypothetical protein
LSVERHGAGEAPVRDANAHTALDNLEIGHVVPIGPRRANLCDPGGSPRGRVEPRERRDGVRVAVRWRTGGHYSELGEVLTPGWWSKLRCARIFLWQSLREAVAKVENSYIFLIENVHRPKILKNMGVRGAYDVVVWWPLRLCLRPASRFWQGGDDGTATPEQRG